MIVNILETNKIAFKIFSKYVAEKNKKSFNIRYLRYNFSLGGKKYQFLPTSEIMLEISLANLHHSNYYRI
jgi:hypothetical protein